MSGRRGATTRMPNASIGRTDSDNSYEKRAETLCLQRPLAVSRNKDVQTKL
jgi:hypothetical protein